jgi:F0F1-type ATP synthase delta subunit
MLQRSEKQLVTRYAAAWIQAMAAKPALCRQDLLRLRDMLAQVVPFKRLIDDRLIAPADRIRLLQLLFPKLGLDAMTQAWLLQLARRRRLSLLPAPCWRRRRPNCPRPTGGSLPALFPPMRLKKAIGRKLDRRWRARVEPGAAAEISWSVDPHLLTGFRCLIGSYLLDFSGATKLKDHGPVVD